MNQQGTWVIQCLEFDIAAQGETLRDAQKAFEEAFIGQALINLHHGKEPMEDVPRAHVRFWKKYHETTVRVSADVDVFASPDGADVPPAWMIHATSSEMRLSG